MPPRINPIDVPVPHRFGDTAETYRNLLDLSPLFGWRRPGWDMIRPMASLVTRRDETPSDTPAKRREVVHHGEHRRYEDQRQHGRKDQAADHRQRHGRPDFAAGAEAQSARHHAGHHGNRRHDDG